MMSSRILTSLIAVVLLAPAGSARAATREVLAQGSDQMYWIARIDQASNGAIATLIQSRRVADGGKWINIAQLSQPVVSMSNRGSQLAVVLESGEWMFVWEGGTSAGTTPEDGSRPLMLAGEPGAGLMWGITISRMGRAPTTTGLDQPAARLPPGIRVLEVLSEGRWTMRAELPQPAQRGALSLAIFGGAPMLAALDDQGVVHVFTWDQTKSNWRSIGTVKAPTTSQAATAPSTQPKLSQRIKLLNGLDRPGLWVSNDDGGELSLLLDGERWSTPGRLDVPSADVQDAPIKDATVAGRAVRVVLAPLNTAEKMREFSFAADGSTRGRSDVPTAIPEGEQPTRPSEWMGAVAAALLMMVLLNSVRRRVPASPEELESRGLQLAPIHLRFLAGLIDSLPVSVTLLVVSIRHAADVPVQSVDEVFQFPFYLSLAVYVLHTFVSEWLWGWTIGKRIWGLRVLMIDGAPPEVWAIFLRNLLRIVDVALFPLLLIFMTPLRQRGGDIAGETMVVTGKAVQKDGGTGQKDESAGDAQ
jgi:uncharacterized RDD family membrane protein YckC